MRWHTLTLSLRRSDPMTPTYIIKTTNKPDIDMNT